jgi:hypothetical protein
MKTEFLKKLPRGDIPRAIGRPAQPRAQALQVYPNRPEGAF